MSATGTTVVKNASILLISQLITWALTLAFTIVLARYLGPRLVGEYTLASTIWAILGVFITFGMDTLLAKEIARSPFKTPDLLGTSIVVRALFYLIGWGAILVYMAFAGISSSTMVIITILGVAHLFAQGYSAAQAAAQGLELMRDVSIAGIVSRLLNTALGIVVLVLGYGVYGIAIVTVVTTFAGLAVQLAFLKRHYPLRLRSDLLQMRAIIRAGLPYLLSSLGLVAYGQVDVLIISSLLNTTEVGWYSSASRLFGTSMFFPVIFTTALFPALTRAYSNAPASLPTVVRKSFDMMFILSTPIGLGLLVIANPLVILLYGADFAKSGPILALMGIVLIPTYQNILLGQFLTSVDRQNAWTVVMIVATALTIPLDIVLVPWCQALFGNGAIAGSLSFLITELAMVAAGISLLPKGSLGRSSIRVAAQTLCAGLAMVAVAWPLRAMFIAIPIGVGGATYSALILLLRVVPSEDLAIFKQVARAALQRLRRPGPIAAKGV